MKIKGNFDMAKNNSSKPVEASVAMQISAEKKSQYERIIRELGPEVDQYAKDPNHVIKSEYVREFGEKNIVDALNWKAAELSASPIPSQKAKGSGLKRFLVAAALVITFGLTALGLGACNNQTSTAHIGATATGSEIVYVAGKDAKHVDLSIKDSKGVEYANVNKTVSKGEKVTVSLNKPEMFDGEYTIRIYDGISAEELTNKVFEGSFQRTGNPVKVEESSMAQLINNKIEYKAGKDIRYVFVSIVKNGVEYGDGMVVAPGQEISYELNKTNVYDGKYNVGVTDGADSSSLTNTVLINGKSVVEWTREGNAALKIENVSVNDVYKNTGILGVTPTRETKVYFESNKVPDKVDLQFSGTFGTRNDSFTGSKIVREGEGYYVDASGMLNSVNNKTVNYKLTVNNASEKAENGTFVAAEEKVAPTELAKFSGYTVDSASGSGQKYLNLVLDTTIPSALQSNAMFSISYTKINRETGIPVLPAFSETKNVAQCKTKEENGKLIIQVPINNSEFDYESIVAKLEPKGGQDLLMGQCSQIEVPDIVYVNNYKQLENALNLKIGNTISATSHQAKFNTTTNLYNMDLLIGTDGKVRAKWLSYISGKDIYAEYQIPGISASSTFDQWMTAVAGMTVPTTAPADNFTETGTLSLTDATELFRFALNQRGSSADKTLFGMDASGNLPAGFRVEMVKLAQTGASSYNFTMFAVGNDGRSYEISAVYGKTGVPTLYDLATNSNKNCATFGKISSFDKANSLFSAQGTQPAIITAYNSPVASQSSAVSTSLRTAATAISVASSQQQTAGSNTARRDFLNRKSGTSYGGQTRNQMKNQYKQGPNQYGR